MSYAIGCLICQSDSGCCVTQLNHAHVSLPPGKPLRAFGRAVPGDTVLGRCVLQRMLVAMWGCSPYPNQLTNYSVRFTKSVWLLVVGEAYLHSSDIVVSGRWYSILLSVGWLLPATCWIYVQKLVAPLPSCPDIAPCHDFILFGWPTVGLSYLDGHTSPRFS